MLVAELFETNSVNVELPEDYEEMMSIFDDINSNIELMSEGAHDFLIDNEVLFGSYE